MPSDHLMTCFVSSYFSLLLLIFWPLVIDHSKLLIATPLFAGTICSLKQWWDRLCALGPMFGYHPNATKTWLITKEDLHAEAENVFKDTDIQITTEGRPYLGVPLGTDEYRQSFLDNKVDQWKTETKLLATIAHTQPHAACIRSVYTWHGKQMALSVSHDRKHITQSRTT